MPNPDLTNTRSMILGIPGSGKSELVKHILNTTKRHLVYDPMNEYPNYRRYIPEDRNDPEELSMVINQMVIPWKPELFVIDESNKYVPPKPSRLIGGITDLNDLSRHWEISWILVARRPSQFHTDVIELAHYLFIFQLSGKNDYIYLENFERGLGDTVRNLPKFHFAIYHQAGAPGEKVTIHAPIDINANIGIPSLV